MHTYFFCIHLYIHTHKTCSERSWLNYWICFGHNILHKQSETPRQELQWSCLSCVRGSSREQLGRAAPPGWCQQPLCPGEELCPAGRGTPGCSPGQALLIPWELGLCLHSCLGTHLWHQGPQGHLAPSHVLRLFQFFSYSIH